MKNLKWEDLKFEHHGALPSNEFGVQCMVDFDNGEWCSIVGAPYITDEENGTMRLYGNGDTSFEISSSSTEKTRRQVKGWLSKVQVVRHLNYLKNK